MDLWTMVYTVPVFLAWIGATVVLFLKRRHAPRGWLLGACTFAGLAFFNAAMLGMNQLLMYQVQNGEVVALVVWRYQLIMLLSMLVQAVSIGLLTLAILAGRSVPPNSVPPDDSDASE